MTCTTSCIIAGAFIFSSFFMSIRVNKQTLKNPLFQLLNDKQKVKYIQISEERKNIYFKGFSIGLIISIFSLFLLNNNKLFKMNKISNICFILASSFSINYFFYILHPKSDYMINHLSSYKEKQAWLEIYKKMQFNYHLGFLLGLLGMIFIGNSFC